jgi:3-dehydroquinate dehydratase/shikimate dehydrogenase
MLHLEWPACNIARLVATANNQYISRLLHLRLPRVCVAVTGDDPGEMIAKAEAIARDNTFIEFRLDYLAKPGLALPRLREFTEFRPHVVAIATCRRAASGGKYKGAIPAQMELLAKAADAGCQLVDVELQTALRLKPAQLEKLRSKAAVILSFHDFKTTQKLEETLKKMATRPADFYKLVGTATSLYDNVTMMKFLEQHRDEHDLIGLCMGEQGIISRVLGVRAGSAFTFGALTADEKTAPGQVTAQELQSTYRLDQVDAATKVYGVAGDPVSHSLSPAIMNAALRRENVNGVYLALHAKSLKDLIACVKDIPLHGLSITMPYKESILPFLDNTDPYTTKIGACNTVVRSQDGKDRGAQIFIMNRSLPAAQKLARQAKARTIKRADLKKLDFDVIINATPVGMGNTRESPLNAEEIKARIVFDMVYDPAETRLLKMARERGIDVIAGSEMFVHQAARQFEIWTGKPAPRDEMLRIVNLALQERAAAHNGSKPAR